MELDVILRDDGDLFFVAPSCNGGDHEGIQITRGGDVEGQRGYIPPEDWCEVKKRLSNKQVEDLIQAIREVMEEEE